MDFKALVKKRGSYKARLTQFKSYLDVVKSCPHMSALQINELMFRLTKIEELYSDFDCIQSDIENVCEIPDEQYKERENFESQYFGAIAVGRDVLNRQNNSAGNGSTASMGTDPGRKGGTHIKLPTIQLPVFAGHTHNWLEFRDTFTSLIHNDNTIPKINKFHYLRAALKDSAAIIIAALDFSADNYDIAWDLVCSRFNNKRLLVNNHIQNIFNIEKIPKESAKSIRGLIDTINRNLRALQTLELPIDGWDALIIHIVSSKLDAITSREWETHRNTLNVTDDLPTLEQLNKFLKGRADLLEAMEQTHNNNIQRRHSDTTHNRVKSFTVSQSPPSQQRSYACPLCKNSHAMYQCTKFKSLPVDSRIQRAKSLRLCLNCLRPGHNTNYCKLGPCKNCKQFHNTLICDTPSNVKSEMVQATSSSPAPSANNTMFCAADPGIKPQSTSLRDNVALSATHNNQCVVLLATAVIQVSDHQGHKHTIRALLDNGSTASFVTESLQAKLKLPSTPTSAFIEGLNHQSSSVSKLCEVTVSSCVCPYSENIQCFVVPRITQMLPTTHVDFTTLNIPQNITLADPSFHTPAPIDMLIGADLFWSVLLFNNISLGKRKPTLSETKFGWLISGPINASHYKNTVHCNHANTQYNDDQLHDQLTQFFDLETVVTHKPVSRDEEECERNFTQTTTREADGRFVVTIPLKESPQKLGESYQQALTRFISLERKFKREPKFKAQYTEFIKEYISLGHMTENTTPDEDKHAYIMPHHGVIRESSLSTKCRVVFEANVESSSGYSLNSLQRVGPTVQSDLISILLRFRLHKYVVTADIQMAYRMVSIVENQRALQQILWRLEPDEQIKQYKLNTVTYGTASAPYLTTRCLVQLARECTSEPVSEAILHGFYVDDFSWGSDDSAQLIDICQGVINQLKSGQFNLRKWNSNNTHIIQELVGENSSDELLNLSNNEYSKTLGLHWACKADELLFSTNILQHKYITKRTILSSVAQVFDPIGLIAPCLLQGRVILQELWSAKIPWDTVVSDKIQKVWCKFMESLRYIDNIRIPRHVTCEYPIKCDIHTFSDASLTAYSACIFVRSVDSDNNVSVRLLTAKCRVAPIKPMTVPRLELCGALLASRLADKVKSALRMEINSFTYWCDSMVVLSWIKTAKTELLKPFVYNRIHEINTLTEPNSWMFCKTHLNPADIGSRGIDARQLECSTLWWSGPDFLSKPESEWPSQPAHLKESELPELKIQSQLNVSDLQSVEFITQFSNFSQLQRVTAYILRFIHNCRHRQTKQTGSLTLNELNASILALCKIAQLETFTKECKLLKNKRQLPTKNKLLNLSPFLDDDEVMRVGGRLSNSHYDYDIKHPILLHASHHLTILIFRYYHKQLMHAGPQLLLANVRHKFWALNGRNLARKTVRDCVTCCRFSGRVKQPIMGNLPEKRLHSEYPFMSTFVDFAGPIMILNRKGRGSRLIKSYAAIFVCAATRAVDIQLAGDLSCQTYISALSRFIARRGKPVSLYSDNATCFTGARNELSKFLRSNSEYLKSYAANLSIKFEFSPVYSPHFNGVAESAVKSMKHILKRVLGLTNLTYEEMNTVLTQIEAILNSRPLTPMSSDPSDLAALTPAHFLIGRTLTVLPSSPVQDASKISTFSRYMRTQQLKAHFWDRFYKEYISELQKRQKWRTKGEDLIIGEMVLVKDDRMPPNRWLLGRVTAVFPGSSDGIARVADVRTQSGTIRRAFNRLCPLPVTYQPEQVDQSSASSSLST